MTGLIQPDQFDVGPEQLAQVFRVGVRDGRFRFDSLPDPAPFSFRADGYTRVENNTHPLDGTEGVVVTLTARGVIPGRVVDAATGKPVPRFTVKLTFFPDPRDGEPTTGIDGR